MPVEPLISGILSSWNKFHQVLEIQVHSLGYNSPSFLRVYTKQATSNKQQATRIQSWAKIHCWLSNRLPDIKDSPPVHDEAEPLKATLVCQFLLHCGVIFLLLFHMPGSPIHIFSVKSERRPCARAHTHTHSIKVNVRMTRTTFWGWPILWCMRPRMKWACVFFGIFRETWINPWKCTLHIWMEQDNNTSVQAWKHVRLRHLPETRMHLVRNLRM